MDNKPEHAPPLPEPHILEQAAEWFATLGDEDTGPEQHDRWREWIEDHPEHRRAWRYVEQISARFQQARDGAGRDGAGRILRHTRGERLTRRRLLTGGAAGLAAWLVWSRTPLPEAGGRLMAELSADQRTATGEIRDLALPDGGHLWLNSASAVDLAYGEALRRLTLHDGEVLIQTAPDPRQRPFVVDTRHGRLRALGTRFTVRRHADHSFLAVYEGAVAIRTGNGREAIINAGRQTTFQTDSIHSAGPADPARQAWSQGLIVANDLPLGELVAELARYRHGHLGVDPSVAQLRALGTYPTGRPEQALAMLENALPVRARRLLPWWVTLVPA
ncbi:FecR domain-containing protein [Alloalcanivorax sp. C16-2]|uniref:FecR domain-containing protein n=1 Tax=Alloalcanivorax sp. C16-2 TaxID=3390052 RepID=UPI0039705A95